MRTFIISAGVATAALLSGTAYAEIATQDFVQQASVANEFEIESSELALKRTSNDEIKAFARKIIADHEKAGDKLEDAVEASNSKAELEDDLDSKHQTLYDELKNISASDFDKRYIAIQKTAHEEAVALFSDYADHGDDAKVKQFASETLPTLKQHLDHVKKLK